MTGRPILSHDTDDMRLAIGLIPHFTTDPKAGRNPTNARADGRRSSRLRAVPSERCPSANLRSWTHLSSPTFWSSLGFCTNRVVAS
jgi:putative SOS response-associated peptidase YedK